MNETEAKKLTERIVSTWPSSPKGFVWTETLLELDHGPALAAIGRLTREHDESRLTVARYLGVYNAISGRAARRGDGQVCRTCDGGGWVTAAPATHNGHEYTQCEPCPHCTLGRAVAGSKVWRDTGRRAHQAPPPLVEGPAVSFDGYIARLTWRVDTGDTEAADTLDLWAHNLARGHTP